MCLGAHAELKRTTPTAKGPASTFNGDVHINPIYRGEEPSRMIVNLVRFTSGARIADYADGWAASVGVTNNPPGTGVRVTATVDGAAAVPVTVADDSARMPADVALAPFEPMRRRRMPSGAINRGMLDQQGKALTDASAPPGIGPRLRDKDPVCAGLHPAPAGQLKPGGGTPLILTQPRADYRIAAE